MPPESEDDVSSKPATTRQSETTPARRDPEEAQLDEDLQTTRPSRRRHLPLKYKDFVMLPRAESLLSGLPSVDPVMEQRWY
ncbi:hypothetical protein QE152_g20807 [Popillia japonica]|uniref:Uncharacterized protein n=1 Tax=Popillia japonica TaxID=7064 RepID=A0AAW1KQE4_POPJA